MNEPTIKSRYGMSKAALMVWMVAAIAHLQGQVVADPSLLAEIDKIKAVDNHTHVVKVVAYNAEGRASIPATLTVP